MPNFERPNSPADQTPDHRMEHDLWELFVEQQMLMDIVTQQQERLRQQLELQHMLLNEPSFQVDSPLSELLNLEELPEQSIVNPTVVEMLPDLERPENVLCTVGDTLDAQSNELFPLPPTKLFSTPAHKPTDLGFDAPFPYPSNISNRDEHRALYIFTFVDSLAMQLQRSRNLSRPAVANTAEHNQSQPPSRESRPTGTLPKQRGKHNEAPANQTARSKANKRLHDQMGGTPSQHPELDLDCEFGMEHIEKFRANRVREFEYNRVDHTRLSYPAKRGPTNDDRDMSLSSGSDDELKAICRSSDEPAICFYSSVPGGELRAFSPLNQQSSSFDNPQPSTSAQAQAQAQALAQAQAQAQIHAVVQRAPSTRSPSPLTQLMSDLPLLECPMYSITCEQIAEAFVSPATQMTLINNDQSEMMNLIDFTVQDEIDYLLNLKPETADEPIPPPPPPPPPTPENDVDVIYDMSSQLANLPKDSNDLLNNIDFEFFKF